MSTKQAISRTHLRPVEIVEMTGLSKTTVFSEIYKGNLIASKVGKSRLIKIEDYEAWASQSAIESVDVEPTSDTAVDGVASTAVSAEIAELHTQLAELRSEVAALRQSQRGYQDQIEELTAACSDFGRLLIVAARAIEAVDA